MNGKRKLHYTAIGNSILLDSYSVFLETTVGIPYKTVSQLHENDSILPTVVYRKAPFILNVNSGIHLATYISYKNDSRFSF